MTENREIYSSGLSRDRAWTELCGLGAYAAASDLLNIAQFYGSVHVSRFKEVNDDWGGHVSLTVSCCTDRYTVKTENPRHY